MKANPDQIRWLGNRWRMEVHEIRSRSWEAFGQVQGEGSAVLAAMRRMGEPGRAAFASIGDRYEMMAKLLDRFANDVEHWDHTVAGSFDKITPR